MSQVAKKMIACVSFLLLISGCDNKIIDQITVTSGWVIYEFDANFQIQTPGLSFEKDHTCHLPMVEDNDYIEKKTQGRWELIKKDTKKYIKITTSNPNFNNIEFEIQSIETIQDPETLGYLGKMVLESDSIKITCYRVILN